MQWYNRWVDSLPQYQLTAIRVAVATTIALLTCTLFHMDRSYWSLLAIISISASVNIHDLVSRARLLLFVSILGCFIGTFMFFTLSVHMGHEYILLIVVLANLIYIYTSDLNYGVGIFFNCIVLVNLIGSLLTWDYHILAVRIIDLSIGALSMIIVSYLFRGTAPARNITTQVESLLKEHEVLANNPTEITSTTLESLEENQAVTLYTLHTFKYDLPSKQEYQKLRNTLLELENLLPSYHGYLSLIDEKSQHKVLHSALLDYTLQKMQRQFTKLSNKFYT